jgi:hypothetical protein
VTDAGSSIPEKEREAIITDLLQKCITQSIHFDISPSKLKKIFETELSKFKKAKQNEENRK